MTARYPGPVTAKRAHIITPPPPCLSAARQFILMLLSLVPTDLTPYFWPRVVPNILCFIHMQTCIHNSCCLLVRESRPSPDIFTLFLVSSGDWPQQVRNYTPSQEWWGFVRNLCSTRDIYQVCGSPAEEIYLMSTPGIICCWFRITDFR